MPYLEMTCAKCGHSQRRWHNKTSCPQCGAATGMQPIKLQGTLTTFSLLTEEQRRQIRAAREEMGLTRRECAELTKLGYTTIQQLENGSRNARIEILRQLCEPLGLAVDVVIRKLAASERRVPAATNGAAKPKRRRKKKAVTCEEWQITDVPRRRKKGAAK